MRRLEREVRVGEKRGQRREKVRKREREEREVKRGEK